MADTPTTPASVAARLTDEYLLGLADHYLPKSDTAAVLRDYVRLRKLANAVKACADVIDAENCRGDDYGNVKELKRLLAEAEEGETK